MIAQIKQYFFVSLILLLLPAVVLLSQNSYIPQSKEVNEKSEVKGTTTTEWTEISVGGNFVPLIGKDGNNDVVMYQDSSDSYYRFNQVTKQFDLLYTNATAVNDRRYAANEIRSTQHELLANRILPVENYFPANLITCSNNDVFVVGRNYSLIFDEFGSSPLVRSNIPITRLAAARISSGVMTSTYSYYETPAYPTEIPSYPDIIHIPFYSNASICLSDGNYLTVEGVQSEDYNVISTDPFVFTLEAPEYFTFNTISPTGTLLARGYSRMPGIGVNIISGPSALFYHDSNLYLLRSDGIFSTTTTGGMSLAYSYPVGSANHYAQVINNDNNIVLISSTSAETYVHEYTGGGWVQRGQDLPAADGAQIIKYGASGYLAILDRGTTASVYEYNPNNNLWSQVGDDLVADNILQNVLIQHVDTDIVISFIDRETSARYARVFYLDDSGGVTPTPTATPTTTPTTTATPTATPTDTPTDTPTPSVTVTATPTLTITATATPSISATPTTTVTGTVTTTGTGTPTATATINPTLTAFPSIPGGGDSIVDNFIDVISVLPIVGQLIPTNIDSSGNDSGSEGAAFGSFIEGGGFAVVTLAVVSGFDFWGSLLMAALSTQKRKQGLAGIVYDSVTKNPVARAILRVHDAETGSLLRTLVTDSRGVFQLTQTEKKIKILAQRAGYEFPTKVILTETDGAYQKIYKGEEIDAQVKGAVVCSIPIDPVEVGGLQKFLSIAGSFWSLVVEYFADTVYVVLFIYSAIVLIYSPTFINTLLFMLPLAVIVVKNVLINKGKVTGIVKTVNGNLVKGVQIGLYEPEFKTLQYSTYTNNAGEYAFVVENREFILKIMDDRYALLFDDTQVEELLIAPNKGNEPIRSISKDLLLRVIKTAG